MIGRTPRIRAVPVLLAAAVLGFAAPWPAQASFTRAASASTAVTMGNLLPPTAVAVPGGIACAGTVRVTWTPSLSSITLPVGAISGFDPTKMKYNLVLTNGGSVFTATVTGGGTGSYDFSTFTLLGYYSATVQASYYGWTSTITSSAVSRGCLI